MTCKRPSRKAVATSACVVQSVLILHLLAHSKHYGDDITWVATIQGRTSYAFSLLNSLLSIRLGHHSHNSCSSGSTLSMALLITALHRSCFSIDPCK